MKLTKQGVRNLNIIGPKPRTTPKPAWTCPPHLPAAYYTRDFAEYVEVLRCRVCKEVLDSVDVSWP
jgi:hypothetical protein